MKIIFATNNNHKLEEIRNILGNRYEVLSLHDIGCDVDIPETGKTLEENAAIKAEYVYNRYGISVFADDTGLEVDALNGEPGVYSARYAGGEGHDSEANMRKLLANLKGNDNRKAHFRTVIAYIKASEELTSTDVNSNAKPNIRPLLFEGRVEGCITTEKRGDSGFGYDPIFQPDGFDETFAELGNDVKNTISHRARAVAKFVEYLNS